MAMLEGPEGPSCTSVELVLAEASKASLLASMSLHAACTRTLSSATSSTSFPRKTRWSWLFMQGSLDCRVSTESWLPQVSGFHCIGLMVSPQGHGADVLD